MRPKSRGTLWPLLVATCHPGWDAKRDLGRGTLGRGGQGQRGRWGGWHMGTVAHGDCGTAGPAGLGQTRVPMRGGEPLAGSGRCPRRESPWQGWAGPGWIGSPWHGEEPSAGRGWPGGDGEPRGGFGEPLAPAAGAGWEAGGGDKITISGRPDRAMLSGRDLQNGIF